MKHIYLKCWLLNSKSILDMIKSMQKKTKNKKTRVLMGNNMFGKNSRRSMKMGHKLMRARSVTKC